MWIEKRKRKSWGWVCREKWSYFMLLVGKFHRTKKLNKEEEEEEEKKKTLEEYITLFRLRG